MVEGAQFEFNSSTLSDSIPVYSSELFSGVFQPFNEIAMARRGVLAPNAARSETATESSTPSSTTTATTAATAMASPSARWQKIAHKMEMSKTHRVAHATQSRRKRSARSNVRTSSFGLAVTPTYSTRISKRKAPSRSRRPGRSSSEMRAEATDADDSKNYYYDGPRRYGFLELSYSPREQYCMPGPPPPPPLPTTYLQQYEDHYQSTGFQGFSI
ncbi:hypothetical protein V1524DRAFT_412190 [Lipomyces starkeyi]